MTPSRPAIVVNRTKVRDVDGLRRAVTSLVAQAGEPLWLETAPEDPGEGMARIAVSQGADLVMSYGGDGTHRACAAALAGTGVPLALLPAGTGNLLARRLRVPGRLDRAVEVALHGSRRPMDVCHAGGECFLIMAGMGFDASVLARTSPLLKQHVGWFAYWLAGMQSAGRSPDLRIVMDMDGGRQVVREGVGVVVANVGTLPGGLKLLPAAVEDNGLLTVAVLTSDSLVHWATLGVQMLTHRVPSQERLPYWQANEVHVAVDQPVRFHADGEVLEDSRERSFRVSPLALSVCVPDARPTR
jgi:diacylglycerol kinase family enzyme